MLQITIYNYLFHAECKTIWDAHDSICNSQNKLFDKLIKIKHYIRIDQNTLVHRRSNMDNNSFLK